MKLLILFCLSFLLTITGKTQLDRGQFLTGGSFSVESIKNEGTAVVNYKTSNIFLSPNIGYFIIPKLVGGLRTDIRIYKQKTPNDIKHTFTSLSPFLRYYFLKANQKINFFSDVSYIHSKSKFNNTTGTEYIEKGNGYSISAGPAVFLNDYIALEFVLGYRHTKIKDARVNKTSTINSGLGLQVHLGKLKIKKTKESK